MRLTVPDLLLPSSSFFPDQESHLFLPGQRRRSYTARSWDPHVSLRPSRRSGEDWFEHRVHSVLRQYPLGGASLIFPDVRRLEFLGESNSLHASAYWT